MKIYHNPRCGKSRQSLAILEENAHKPEIIRYLETPPSRSELEAILKMLDISPLELIRKGERIFKENYKGKELSDAEWLEALLAHPKLMERPIVVHNGKAVIGRPPENVLELFK